MIELIALALLILVGAGIAAVVAAAFDRRGFTGLAWTAVFVGIVLISTANLWLSYTL